MAQRLGYALSLCTGLGVCTLCVVGVCAKLGIRIRRRVYQWGVYFSEECTNARAYKPIEIAAASQDIMAKEHLDVALDENVTRKGML